MSFVDRQELINILTIVRPELLGWLPEKDLNEIVEAWTQGIDIVQLLKETDPSTTSFSYE